MVPCAVQQSSMPPSAPFVTCESRRHHPAALCASQTAQHSAAQHSRALPYVAAGPRPVLLLHSLALVASPVLQSGPAIPSVYTTKLFRADPSAFRGGGELQASNPTNRAGESRCTLSTWHLLVRASANSLTIVCLVVQSLQSIYSVESPLTDRTLVTALCCWSLHLGTPNILVADRQHFLSFCNLPFGLCSANIRGIPRGESGRFVGKRA